MTDWFAIRIHLGALAAGLGLMVLVSLAAAAPATANGKIAGKLVSTSTGEPIAYADVVLQPADSTMHPVGAYTNADGTYLLVAPAGRYTIKFRALSFATKTIQGIVVTEGGLLSLDMALAPEAIQQEEIVVEAKARQNTEAALLQARRKATAVGDAVSAEEVRRSPDRNVADVLRRVTGLSVTDNKYVFVRGLGERYSSTEVDGVRIASPEQNKRVVPLDLLPANLLENVTVQKTYTADRPGEFGGGDVQVRTKDFPGVRTWSFSVLQGATENLTFQDRLTYAGGQYDKWGYGAATRKIPDAVGRLGGGKKLDEGTLTPETEAEIARSFDPVYSARAARTIPNGGYVASYGDQYKLFGHELGAVVSGSLARSYDQVTEAQRLFRSASGDTMYDYSVQRSTGTVQLSGISGLSYRLSPNHQVHLRGFYTNTAADEVRRYEGPDHTRDEAITGGHLVHRDTRLMYLQRTVISGAADGQHRLAKLLGADLDWRFTRSWARRQQPDRREVTYDRRYWYDGDTAHWQIGSQANREWGDMSEDGWGTTLGLSVPYALGGWGKGRMKVGYDRQSKQRDNFYRRFRILYPGDPSLWEQTPDTLFSPGNVTHVYENTFTDTRYTDNYAAHQLFEAGYVSLDVPFGNALRGNFGVRMEKGTQDVQSFDLFHPDVVLQEGHIHNTDWLPSGNLIWSMTRAFNVRAAASRTLSRPDLNELSPSPSLEYQGGALVLGNPKLQRAQIDNYDLRLEAFPGRNEVLATGVFYKQLHGAIEQVIQGSADPLIYPRNSDDGRNVGVEMEARVGLERLWRKLATLSVNTNASVISSEVHVDQLSNSGSENHPLQGQAAYLVNAGLHFDAPNGAASTAVYVSATGRRLTALGFAPLPDIYEEPSTTLDVTGTFLLFRQARVKFLARNLTDPVIRRLQGPYEVESSRRGRSYAIAVTFGQ